MIEQRDQERGGSGGGGSARPRSVEAVRPIVQKAMNDPRTPRRAPSARSPPAARSPGEIQKNKPSKAARNLAESRKLHQGRVESSVHRTSRRP